MLTGPVEGRFLEFLVFTTRPRRVLELGTHSGYSAISMARAAAGRGDPHVRARRGARRRRARYLEEAGFADRVTAHVGPALETIERLDGPWDVVFLDADKVGYLDYYEAVLAEARRARRDRRRQHALSGRVLDPEHEAERVRAIVAFNRRVAEDERVMQVLLTMRDGVTLIRRAA